MKRPIGFIFALILLMIWVMTEAPIARGGEVKGQVLKTLLDPKAFITCEKMRWRWKEQLKNTEQLEMLEGEFNENTWSKRKLGEFLAAAARIPDGSAFGIDRVILLTARWPLKSFSDADQSALANHPEEYAKKINFPGVDWKDPRGFMPPQAHLTADLPTSSVFVTFTVTNMDYCYSDKIIRLELDSLAMSAQWETSESDGE